MVDKEKVVKALQCCTGDASRCDECPYDNKCLSEDETENTFFKDILEVINHYEEQNEQLKAELKMMMDEAKRYKKEADTWKRVRVILENDGAEKGK